MKHLLLAFLLITTPFLHSEKNAPQKGTHRILQFENDLVKVWKTVIMPHQPLSMHRHDHDRVVVGIKGGVLKKIEQSGEVSDLILETGKAYWLTADPIGTLHADINESDEPIEVMVIEFKTPQD
jgi:beta-alanine degradation protein BauB